MPNTRISALTAAVSVSGTDVFPSVQTAGIGPVKTSLDQIKVYSTGLTAGYIPFGAGTSSAFNSSANLFWNNTNGRLGINTSNPAVALHVKAGSASTFVNFVLENTNGGTNAKCWDFINNGNSLYLRATNDASNAANYAYVVQRSTNDYTIAVHTWYVGASTEVMRLESSGNLGLGTASFGWPCTRVLGIANGTAPTAGVASTIQIYSSNLSAGNTMLSLYTEGTSVNANTTAAATHRIAIRVNGTVYYLLANTSA